MCIVTISSAGAYGLPGGLKHHGHPSLSLEVIDITFALKSVRKEIGKDTHNNTFLRFLPSYSREHVLGDSISTFHHSS